MRLAAIVSLPILTLATGCAITPTATPTLESAPTVKGNVHGGQQPIVGSHVYMFAAGTTGYGGNGIAPTAANASVSLLSAAVTGLSDSVGAYVLTDQNGNFNIPTYSCTPGTQVYLYALGGNPGAGTNSAAGLMAILGACPASGNLDAAVPFAFVNEVTTVAAAYAFAGFASDATHVGSSGTPLAQTGIANAFLSPSNLVKLVTGTALISTPSGNGTVPQKEINTLANVLTSCVNTADGNSGISSSCSYLFSLALSGGTSGTTPTDTATVAVNIAHNPTNVASLYAIPRPAVAFAPTLSAQPNDFTLTVVFAEAVSPSALAIDGSGNVWLANGGINGPNSISKLSNTGANISPSGGYTGGGLNAPQGIAVDRLDNVWTANYNANSISEFSNSGNAISPASGYTGGGLTHSNNIAVDGSGNVWSASYFQSARLSEFSSSGVAISPSGGYIGGGLTGPLGIAIDGSGNVWVANGSCINCSFALSEFSNGGTPISSGSGYFDGTYAGFNSIALDSSGNAWAFQGISGSSSLRKFAQGGLSLSGPKGYTSGGLGAISPVALDGSGNIWVGSSEFSNAGTAISGTHGFSGLLGSDAIAIDGAGNAWSLYSNNSQVTELIGAATPVITPICAGLPSTPTADGSSNLGTRP